MVRSSTGIRRVILFSLLALSINAQTYAQAQSKPDEQPAPNYTRPTVLVRPVPAPPTAPPVSAETATPDIASAAVPTIITQGLLVETVDGRIVGEQDADETYNPASAVKLGTALAALKNFGIDHRFNTAVWTTGTFDAASATVTGDLIVSGRDPSFHYEHAVMI